MMRETIWEQFEHAQEWQRHYNFSLKRVRLVDGTSTRSPYLMKRKAPDETWQYRKMTRREFYQVISGS
jgi:hypothetical protein